VPPNYLQGRHSFTLHFNVTPLNDPPTLSFGLGKVLRLAQVCTNSETFFGIGVYEYDLTINVQKSKEFSVRWDETVVLEKFKYSHFAALNLKIIRFMTK